MAQEIEIDLLTIRRGTVTAPAGCGKTHLIADALKRHKLASPILVLTHTNAGVVALRNRLSRLGVSSSAYSLATIDGWAMKLVSTFPIRSSIDLNILKLEKPKDDYPAIRRAAVALLKSGHIRDALRASYTQLIVDEYQDCSLIQHAIVYYAAKTLPVCTLGDPMQAIFGFGSDELANWTDQVCKHFPIAGELKHPWRWENVGADSLGQWLLDVRHKLMSEDSVDLLSAPDNVSWIKLKGDRSDFEKILEAARTPATGRNESVLIIGDSMNAESRYRIASSVHGAVTVEKVDLSDLVSFSKKLAIAAPGALELIANFAQSLMTNVGATDLVRRTNSLQSGAARKPATAVESTAIEFIRDPSYGKVADVLVEISRESGVRTYRPAVVSACLRALRQCHENKDLSFQSAVVQMREQNRILGRPLPKRAIGSTLLLKGLEAETVVILDADNLDAKNLYVAMTRGSKRLVVCSASSTLRPRFK